MSRRINASLLVLVIALAAFALSGKQSITVANAAPAASYDLLSSLPSSDFIVYVDTQRILTDVMPAILIENVEARAELESNLDKFKKDMGFDPRLLDAVAIGLNLNSSKRAHDFDFAVIARGRFDATAVIDSGLNAATKGSHGELEKQTQQYEGRTIYLLGAAKPTQTDGAAPGVDSEPGPNTMTFVALDSNTVAFGNLKSVQATIDAAMGRERVDDELVQLATRTPGAVVSFSGNLTPETASNFRLGNKQADESISSIRQIFGSLTVAGNDMEGRVNIRTEAEEQARQLSTSLNALKFMAKLGISNDASDEEKTIESLLNDVEVFAVGNEVQITSRVPLTDIAPFVCHL